jgi:hypothetical protein
LFHNILINVFRLCKNKDDSSPAEEHLNTIGGQLYG